MAKGGDTLRFDHAPDRSVFRQTTFLTLADGAVTQTVREYIGGLYERETTSEGLVRHIHYIAGGSGVAAILTDERSASTAAQRRHLDRDLPRHARQRLIRRNAPRRGFMSSAASAAASPLIFSGTHDLGLGDTIGTLAAATVGGTVSKIGGGKFANGAISGAMGYLHNALSAEQRVDQVAEATSDASDAHMVADKALELDLSLNERVGGRSSRFTLLGHVALKRIDPFLKALDLHAQGGNFFVNPTVGNVLEVGGVFYAPISAGGLLTEGIAYGAREAFGNQAVDNTLLRIGSSKTWGHIDRALNYRLGK